MVVQDILYKQENGDLIDADETNSDKSFILNNMLNYALDGATVTNQNNLVMYSDFAYTNKNTISSFSNSSYGWVSTYYGIYGGTNYDSYSDGSVDGTKWANISGITLTEVSNTNINGASSGTGDKTFSASTIDLNPSGDYSTVVFRFYAFTSGSGLNSHAHYVLIRDATGTELTLYTNFVGSATNLTTDKELRFEIDTTTDLVTPYVNGVAQSTVDISTLADGEVWHLRFRTNATNISPGGNIKIYPIVYTNGGSVTSQTLTTDALTIADSDLFILKNKFLNSAPTTTLSFNGTDFNSVNEGVLSSSANNGTNIKIKHAWSGATEKMQFVTDYAVYYS